MGDPSARVFEVFLIVLKKSKKQSVEEVAVLKEQSVRKAVLMAEVCEEALAMLDEVLRLRRRVEKRQQIERREAVRAQKEAKKAKAQS